MIQINLQPMLTTGIRRRIDSNATQTSLTRSLNHDELVISCYPMCVARGKPSK